MNALKKAGTYVVLALTLFGILYKFILPFTPVWFDLIAWSAIGIAFLTALVMSRKKQPAVSHTDTEATHE